ncbi:hypothetical protein [Gracilibacillus lacisalsi]|uniref:hypothetical protein n=1 Tax=Gracilibacillus lacisalsi TaxID=393087 RepID=UPI000370CB76|nr:hypothetical protein [Gracilibacillus lacisalsi]
MFKTITVLGSRLIITLDKGYSPADEAVKLATQQKLKEETCEVAIVMDSKAKLQEVVEGDTVVDYEALMNDTPQLGGKSKKSQQMRSQEHSLR